MTGSNVTAVEDGGRYRWQVGRRPRSSSEVEVSHLPVQSGHCQKLAGLQMWRRAPERRQQRRRFRPVLLGARWSVWTHWTPPALKDKQMANFSNLPAFLWSKGPGLQMYTIPTQHRLPLLLVFIKEYEVCSCVCDQLNFLRFWAGHRVNNPPVRCHRLL